MGSAVTESSTFSASVTGPDAGNKVTAASVRTGLSDLACRTFALVDGKITVKTGVTFLGNTGCNWTNNGTTTLNGATTCAALTVAASGSITVPSTGNVQNLGKSQRRALVYLSDADQTVDVTQGNMFVIATPAASRVITLRMTTGTLPVNSDWMRFAVTDLNGFTVTFKREGSPGSSVAAFTSNVAELEVQMSGGVWRGCGGANYSYGPQW